MRRVSISYLKPGMELGYPIYNSRSDELLVAGSVLTETYIQRLQNMGFDYIWIDDGSFSDNKEKEVVTLESRIATTRKVREIMIETRSTGKLNVNMDNLQDIMMDFTSQIFQNQEAIFNLATLQTYDDYTFSHSVNVCILSLMTGITLGYNKDKLIAMGIGALLHDMGKTRIPERVLNKPSKLTDEEFSLIKKHTIFGYELINEHQNLGVIPAIIALKHHENYDGSGYPSGCTWERIPEYAQVVAIADRFDAITGERIYRKAFPAQEGFEMCAASGNYYFKANVVHAFLQNIAIYPQGAIVELNDGSIGIVLDTPKGYPLFPRVKLIYGYSREDTMEDQIIHLKDAGFIQILRVLNEDELENIQGYQINNLSS